MAVNDAFTNMKVSELRKFLKERDIQISVNVKSRKMTQLLELCKLKFDLFCYQLLTSINFLSYHPFVGVQCLVWQKTVT